MSFIGIVSDKRCFEKLKTELLKNIQNDQINIIHINLRSINNIKNIKFETIILENEIKKFINNKTALKKICENTKYILINTDINKDYDIIYNPTSIFITYGLNQKAHITISSITDTDVLVFCQKSIKNKLGKTTEIEERRIKINDKNKLKVYEILILYTMFIIYSKNIIEEI